MPLTLSWPGCRISMLMTQWPLFGGNSTLHDSIETAIPPLDSEFSADSCLLALDNQEFMQCTTHIDEPSLPTTVRNEDAMNLSSELWSAVDVMDDVGSTQRLSSLQRKAIDMWNMKSRCEEEETIVQNDMQSAISYSQSEIETVNKLIKQMNGNDSSAVYDIGATSLLTKNHICAEFRLQYYRRCKRCDEAKCSDFDVEDVAEFIDTHLSDGSDADSDRAILPLM